MEPQRNRDAHIVRKSMVLRAVRWDRRDYIGLSSTLDYMRFRGEKRVARHYMRLQGLKDSRWFWRQRGLQGLIIRGALDYMRGKAFVFWLNLWNIAVKHWSSWSRCAGESLRASPCGQVLAGKSLRASPCEQALAGKRAGPFGQPGRPLGGPCGRESKGGFGWAYPAFMGWRAAVPICHELRGHPAPSSFKWLSSLFIYS